MNAGKNAVARSGIVLLCGLILSGFTGSPLSALGTVYGGTGPVTAGQIGGLKPVNKEQAAKPAVDPVPQIIRAVSASVVGIIGKASGESGGPDDRYNLTHGSGIIVKADGWIITNAHVMEGLQNAVVITSDGKSYNITDTYLDEVSDLALIKIAAKS